ncbi:hypothetical protein [Rubrobacter calidifluminis]|uniref:hypothetical protein n=1 Tax=Rubrobacter calidifluminis TaxID=1392640 RepID=UPI002361E8C7|nr:hypothetical protein [Rubrobacter calidifluminis]
MSRIPQTASGGKARRGRWWPAFVLGALLVLAAWFFAGRLFGLQLPAKTKEVSGGFASVSVSTQDRAYPPPDTQVFRGRPRRIYVYVVVRDLRTSGGEGVAVSVTRETSGSLFTRLLPGGGRGLKVYARPDRQLYAQRHGVSGVLRFVVSDGAGDGLPEGLYEVRVRSAGGAACESFLIR